MPAPPSPLDVTLGTGAVLRVQAVTPHVYRLRLRSDARFDEPGLVRYGVVRTDLPPARLDRCDDRDTVAFDTGQARLSVHRETGAAALFDGSGRALLQGVGAPQSGPETGFRVCFQLGEGERLYGLGDTARDRLNRRGQITSMVVRNVASYAPIPFLMSTGGWAVFLNSTWFHQVDAGQTQADRLVFSGRRGELDLYLIAGETLPLLLDRYTQLTGRPTLLPQFGYGLTWVCDERGVRARDILYEAYEFRRQGIPLDVIGLEPDWMDRHYDFSVDKQWSTERFHQPGWMPHHQPGGFTAALANMGFKLSLWLCCDYDLSEHEEMACRGAARPALDVPVEDRYDEDVVRDPHFHPAYQDTVTRLGEPWFAHLRKFVDNGAAAFKMDGSNQICFHPDRRWHNGMDDEEMHNLYPVLLAKQMSLGFRQHTGRRAMVYTAGGYAGIQQYAATWAGDTGGDAKPLVSLLNHGLSGHSNTSCDMQVWNRAGIHFGFLQPWSQVLSWHQYNQPWFLPPDIYAVFRAYARLRYRLLPYLYSAAHTAASTGLPIMRAMPLVMPDDPRCDELLHQYMLGESLLTAAFTDRICLPPGRWIDYWTGQAHHGPEDLRYAPPDDRGGPLFVRAGAILPTWPDVDYVGQRPAETVGLEVFPHGSSAFTLYEDDGLTDAYLAGEVARTRFTCEAAAGQVVVTVPPRAGHYSGMPARRQWALSVHLEAEPSRVTVNGVSQAASWQSGVLSLTVVEADGQHVVVQMC